MSAWAVIVAAGRGARSGLDRNKVFFEIDGRSVLSRCLDAFEASGLVEGIVLVISEGDRAAYDALAEREGPHPLVKRVVYGGATRRDSVRNGLMALPEDADVVAVHDAARPFVTREVIDATLKPCAECKLEAHRRYIDIQMPVTGPEVIGVAEMDEAARALPFNEKDDYVLFAAKGEKVIISVKGYSMRPFLEHLRDRVQLAPWTALAVGDAVLAEIAPGHFVLHRIIKIEGEQLTLMGDGNIRGTEQCTVSDVCGLVLQYIRPNGNILQADDPRLKRQIKLWRRLLPIRRLLLFIYKSTI